MRPHWSTRIKSFISLYTRMLNLSAVVFDGVRRGLLNGDLHSWMIQPDRDTNDLNYPSHCVLKKRAGKTRHGTGRHDRRRRRRVAWYSQARPGHVFIHQPTNVVFNHACLAYVYIRTRFLAGLAFPMVGRSSFTVQYTDKRAGVQSKYGNDGYI